MATAKKTTTRKAATTAQRAPATKKPAPRKAGARPAAKAPAPTKRPGTAKQAKADAPAPKRDKLVRDGFTIPKSEFAVLQALKERAARLGCSASKKSEVLRAGIKSLAALTDAAFTAAMQAVPSIKTGRPAKSGSGTR